MICPKCGAEVPENIKFCTQCGNALEEPVITQEPVYVKKKDPQKGKMILIYSLIAALFLSQLGSFLYIRKLNKANLESQNSILEGIESLKADTANRFTELDKAIENNGSSIEEVSENLGTLQEDHDELERTITEKVNAVSVAQKCANAVFYIEMYDEDGWNLGSGSGFFIDPSGIAVTNYHVIDGCSSATVMLANGNVYDITGVYDYNIEKDIALIQVGGEGFDVLQLGDCESIVAGEEVYAIGSPSGLDNTISTGIISNVSRYVDGMDYIQFTAPISCGSSGGALLDSNYSVIGITSAYWIGTGDNGTQNLNLAIPINLIEELERNETETLSEVYATNNVFSDAYIYVSSYYVIIPPDGNTVLEVYESTGDPDVTLRYEVDDENLVECEWGEWIDDNTCELNVRALAEGSTIIRFYLLDSNEDIICTDYIYVDVTDKYEDVELVSDPQMLTLKNGSTETLTFTEGMENGGEYLVYSFNSANIECEWGEWIDDSKIELFVTGINPGTDVITISLFDDNDNFVKSIQVPVQVE